MSPAEPATVLGAGAWGTALAMVLAAGGRPVRLWGRDPEQMAGLDKTRVHPKLEGARLADTVLVTADLAAALQASRLVVLAVPAQATRDLLTHWPAASAPTFAVCAAKGLERTTGALQTDIVETLLPAARAAALSGPGFAADVAAGRPFAATIAARDTAAAAALCERFATPTFRPYASGDVTGVQLGGALKNVLAIACGAVEGAGLGESARASMVARGFAELRRVAMARGAKAETLMGLSGLGDVVLTCTSARSRNYALGQKLGQAMSLEAALAAGFGVAEGAATAQAAVSLADKCAVEAPVMQAVADMLQGTRSLADIHQDLINRPLKVED